MSDFIYKHPSYIGVLMAVIGLGAIGYGVYAYAQLEDRAQRLDVRIAELETNLSDTKKELEATAHERGQLIEALYSEQAKNAEFARQIDDIFSTVGTLDKLSKRDPELLNKYSKVYFLNENYRPSKLTQINDAYVHASKNDLYFHDEALPFLNGLMQEAANAGLALSIVSAYRSFDTQSGLKSAYSVQYGSGANAFSADQGYSEHQLGTTVDFTSPEVGPALDGFEESKEYAWLLKNAHRYGFILSYPEKNSFYVFEPWHWRFVGTELATDLYNRGMNFYDMDQREIDEYLISLFD